MTIRTLSATTDISFAELARRYNVTAAAIALICYGRKWREAGGPITPRGIKRNDGERHKNARLTARQVQEMRRLRAEHGRSYNKIGAQFGVTPSAARNICQGRSWKGVK